MNSAQDPYDVFISYAREDNLPIVGHSLGWIEALREQLIAEYRSVTGRDLRVYLDKERIDAMDNWRNNVLDALRGSRFLLACVSPAYFESKPCRWEWQEYLHPPLSPVFGSRRRKRGGHW